MDRASDRISMAMIAGTKASSGIFSHIPAAAAQETAQKASAKAARRDGGWRRRKLRRLAWLRNQIWLMVEERAAIRMPKVTTTVTRSETPAKASTKGAKTPLHPNT